MVSNKKLTIMNNKVKVLALEIKGYPSTNLGLTTFGNSTCLIVNNPSGGYITINHHNKPTDTSGAWKSVESINIPVKWKTVGKCEIREYAQPGRIGSATTYNCTIRTATLSAEEFRAISTQNAIIVKKHNTFATVQLAEIINAWKAEELI